MSNVIEFSIKALDEFSGTMDKFSSSLGLTKTETAAVGIAVTGAAVAIGLMMKASLNNAEQMGVMAQKANTSVEAFSAMAFAANYSNVSTESLSQGFKFLGKSLSDSTSAGAQQLGLLGIATKDAEGKSRDMTEVMLDVADAFANSSDTTNQGAAAMVIFGRAGSSMIPMLTQGSGEINKMMVQAKALGMVIGTDFAVSADRINDNLKLMGDVMKGQVNIAMQDLSPTLEALTGQFVKFATEGATGIGIGEVLAAGLKILATVVIGVVGVFATLGAAIGTVLATVVMAAQGDFKGAVLALGIGFEKTKNAGVTAMKEMSNVWDASAISAAAAEAAKIAALRSGTAEMVIAKGGMTENEKAAAALRKELIAGGLALTLSLDPQAKANAAIVEATSFMKAKTITQEMYILRLNQISEELTGAASKEKELADAADKARETIEAAGAAMTESLDPQAKMNKGVAEATEQFLAGSLSSDLYALRLANLSEELTGAAAKEKELADAADKANKEMEKAGEAIRASLDPMSKYKEEIERITAVRAADKITQDEANAAILREKVAMDEAAAAAKAKYSEGETLLSNYVDGLEGALNKAGTVGAQVSQLLVSTTTQMTKGIGDAFASVIVDGARGLDLLKNVGQQVAKTLISSLIQIGIQKLLLAVIGRAASAKVAVSELAAGAGRVYMNAFAATSLIPGGIVTAPAVAAGAVTVALAGAAASAAAGAGVGGAVGAAHGGLGNVPSEATYLLDKGERVLSPRQNTDLTEFLSGGEGGAGGMSIGSVTIHVLENATSADVYATMDKVQLRQTLGQPIIDALNEMFKMGVRPDFASQVT